MRLGSSELPAHRLEEAVAVLSRAGLPCFGVQPRRDKSASVGAHVPPAAITGRSKRGKGGKSSNEPNRGAIATEILGMEAKIAALGPASRQIFSNENRRPSALLPPAMSDDERLALIRREASLLEQAMPQLDFGLSVDHDDSKSTGGTSRWSERPLHRLYEINAKYVCQRALWREALRRSAPSSLVGNDASAPPRASTALLVELLGEGISQALNESESLRPQLARLEGCELPPVLRKWAWVNTLVDPKEEEAHRQSLLLRVDTEQLHRNVSSAVERILSRCLRDGNLADGDVRARVVVLVDLAQRCSGGQLPANIYVVALGVIKGIELGAQAPSVTYMPTATEISMLLRICSHGIPTAKQAGEVTSL